MQSLNRVKNLQEYIVDQKLDAFLVLTKINRQYLSGFTGSAGALLITKKDAKLFVDSRYTIRAKKESELPVVALANLLTSLSKLRTIAVEDRLLVHELQSLKKYRLKIKWIVTSDVIEQMRAVKTASELNLLRRASKITDGAFKMVRKLVSRRLKEGLTEIEVAQAIESFGKSYGAEELAFESIAAWGPNAASPHHSSSNDKIRKNNFFLLPKIMR